MGFPVSYPDFMMNRGDPELHDFAAWVDGVPVAVRREKSGEPVEPLTDSGGRLLRYPEWITWTVPFEAGQTRTVRSTYWGRNYDSAVGTAATGYILRSGAGWKGPIGEAVIIAQFDEAIFPGQIRAFPASYRWEGERMVWRMRDFEPERDISIQVDLLLEQNKFPPDAFTRPIHKAEQAGGVEGLSILRQARQTAPNPERAPDALDFRLAKFEYRFGEKEAALQIVRRALETSTGHPVAAYIAYQEGLKQPADLLAMADLSPGIRRYLIDAGGLTGSPPGAPRLTVTQREPTPQVGVQLTDPDADLDDWGVTFWPTSEAVGTPLLVAGGFGGHTPTRVEHSTALEPAELAGREAVWFQAWAVDGKGNRTETPVTKLALKEPPPAPEPKPNPAPEPQPATSTPPAAAPEPAPAVAGHWLLWLSLAGLALLVSTALLIRRRS